MQRQLALTDCFATHAFDHDCEVPWLEQFDAAWNYTPCIGKRRTWLYCFTEGWGEPVKLGVSMNPGTRHEAMRSHTWRDMYFAWIVPGTARHERALKHLYRDQRIRNEWFADERNQIKKLRFPNGDEMVASVAKKMGHPDLRYKPKRRPLLPRKLPMLPPLHQSVAQPGD